MRLAIIALAGLLIASEASAQRSVSENETRLIGSRNRERMHPGNPLTVVGSEQEDNSFRDRTPSLMNAEKVAVLVDEDEAYRRRMAMYNSGARFDAGPPIHSRVYSNEPDREAPRHEVAKRKAPKPVESGDGNLALVSGMGMILGLIFLIRKLS